jgi:hypothetical protein
MLISEPILLRYSWGIVVNALKWLNGALECRWLDCMPMIRGGMNMTGNNDLCYTRYVGSIWTLGLKEWEIAYPGRARGSTKMWQGGCIDIQPWIWKKSKCLYFKTSNMVCHIIARKFDYDLYHRTGGTCRAIAKCSD